MALGGDELTQLDVIQFEDVFCIGMHIEKIKWSYDHLISVIGIPVLIWNTAIE